MNWYHHPGPRACRTCCASFSRFPECQHVQPNNETSLGGATEATYHISDPPLDRATFDIATREQINDPRHLLTSIQHVSDSTCHSQILRHFVLGYQEAEDQLAMRLSAAEHPADSNTLTEFCKTQYTEDSVRLYHNRLYVPL
jgi:hypothetical protein